MAANEFENSVRKTMDDFDLHPSAAVWQNVEQRLRERKRKRRILFFILFSCVGLALSGYGILTVLVKSPNPPPIEAQRSLETKPNPDIRNKSITPTGHVTSIDQSEVKKTVTAGGHKNTTERKLLPIRQMFSHVSNTVEARHAQYLRHEKPQQHARSLEHDRFQSHALSLRNDRFQQRALSFSRDLFLKDGWPLQHTPFSTRHVGDSNVTSIAKDSAGFTPGNISKSSDKKRGANTHSTFQCGVKVSVGYSSIPVKRFSFKNPYGSSGSLATPGNSTGGPVYLPPTQGQGTLAVKIGIAAKKSLSRRSSVLVELDYSYMGDRIKIGGNQNTFQSGNAFGRSYYFGSPQNNYSEHFHFVEAPFIYEWRASKNADHFLSLNAGMSGSYLISTNALVYDSAFSGIYYDNASSFNRAHISLLSGLSYHLHRRRFELTTGPEFSFDLTRIIKTDIDKRKYFFYSGLDVRLYFQKKSSH